MPNFNFGRYKRQFFLQYVMSFYSFTSYIVQNLAARFFIFPTIDLSRRRWRYQRTHMLTSPIAQLVA